MSKSKNLSVAVPLLAALHCGAAYCETPPEEKPSAERIQLAAGTKNLTPREQRRQARRAEKERLLKEHPPQLEEYKKLMPDPQKVWENTLEKVVSDSKGKFRQETPLPNGGKLVSDMIPSSDVDAFKEECADQGGTSQIHDTMGGDTRIATCTTFSP